MWQWSGPLVDSKSVIHTLPFPELGSAMADTKLLPEVKPLLLCNDVVTDPETGNVHIVGVFNTIRPHSRPAYPHQHPEFCVFLQLTDFEGEVPAYVDIVRADTQEIVRRSRPYRIVFPNRHHLVKVC